MRWTFQKTQNVMRLSEATMGLVNRHEKVSGLGAVQGRAGIGKTEAVSWLVAQMEGVYVEVPRNAPVNWVLREITARLDGEAYRSYERLFKQLVEILSPPNPAPPLFIDEADNLFRGGTIDILRSLHNRTHVPMVFIGEKNFFARLMRYERIWSRCTMRVSFVPLSEEEMNRIAWDWAGLKLDKQAAQLLAKATGNDFRLVIGAIYHLEQAAKTNKTDTVSLGILERAINQGLIEGPQI